MNHHFTAAVLRVVLAVSAMVCQSAGQSANASNSSNGAGILPTGTGLVAELAKPIDAKKNRVGDTVKAKIVQDVMANGQIIIPRGATLLGHVSDAKVFNREGPQSVLGVVFDKVALKHGQELNLKAVLLALAPPVPGPDPLASSSYDGSKGGGSQPVSGRDSGWIPRSRRDHTRNDALSNAADPNSYGHGADTLRNGFLGSGNRGVFGMPGVTLKSGELISTKSDIKLERGAQMVLETTTNQ